MWGAIVGDIVGSVYEWNPIKTKEFELFGPRSRFTDDSVCTAAVAEILLDELAAAPTMQQWCRRHPGRGYGGFFRGWIERPDPEPYGSYGNGARDARLPSRVPEPQPGTRGRARRFRPDNRDHPQSPGRTERRTRDHARNLACLPGRDRGGDSVRRSRSGTAVTSPEPSKRSGQTIGSTRAAKEQFPKR